jgi:hypothetical protein
MRALTLVGSKNGESEPKSVVINSENVGGKQLR